jgi:hypothetical protein
MSTTRESLMLSDTAMVLLRRYEEVDTHYWAMRKVLPPAGLASSKEIQGYWKEWEQRHNNTHLIHQVQQELLQDIWFLWRYPDIQPIRHLEWHVTLAGELIEWAEQINVLGRYTYSDKDYMDALTTIRFELAQFLKKLLAVYKESAALL